MEVHDEHIPEATFGEIIEHVPQVCVEVALEREGEILLARRTNDPARGEYFWPGGRLYKGEALDDAARRIAREELGVEVDLGERLGVNAHFWDTASVEGAGSRHTVNVVYHARPAGDEEVTLDGQHDDYRYADGVEPWMHEYVREYFEAHDLPRE